MNLLITEQQRDALLQYLLTRPCGEVINAVLWLQSLPPAEPPKDADKTD